MYKRLRAEMFAKHLTYQQVATEIGISKFTLSKKMAGRTEFCRDEMFAIQSKFFPNLTLEYLFSTEES